MQIDDVGAIQAVGGDREGRARAFREGSAASAPPEDLRPRGWGGRCRAQADGKVPILRRIDAQLLADEAGVRAARGALGRKPTAGDDISILMPAATVPI